jgi:hypothetical protein
VFDDPVYGACHDQSRTKVHGKQHPIHIPVLDAAFSAPTLEHACDADEADHDEDLGDERDFHNDVTQVLLFLWSVGLDCTRRVCLECSKEVFEF